MMSLRRLSLLAIFAAACSSDPPPEDAVSDAPGDAPAEAAPDPKADAPAMVAGFTVDDAMARAESGLGFSYFWGGGCWSPGATQKGSCTGSCPSCTHTGMWGADCSGYVAKVWEVPTATDVSSCSHPYSTDTFYNQTTHWKNVARSDVKRGDAFVYRKGTSGHIFLYGSGDAWGWITAYEAKGCSYGILKDSRTASTDYKVIRRDGF